MESVAEKMVHFISATSKSKIEREGAIKGNELFLTKDLVKIYQAAEQGDAKKSHPKLPGRISDIDAFLQFVRKQAVQ